MSGLEEQLNDIKEELDKLREDIPNLVRKYFIEQKEQEKNICIQFDSRDELKKASEYMHNHNLLFRPIGFQKVFLPRYVEQQLKEAGFNYGYSK